MARTLKTIRRLIVPLAAALSLASWPAGAITPIVQPEWQQLPPQTRQILAPLEKEWSQLEPFRRQKWLGIADRYPAMKPEEQERVQKQMLDWARLTPEQRTMAREKFKQLKKDSPEKRELVKQQWEEYKGLPDEEKQRLKEQAAHKPPVKPAPSGPAALKPLSQAPNTAPARETPPLPLNQVSPPPPAASAVKQ